MMKRIFTLLLAVLLFLLMIACGSKTGGSKKKPKQAEEFEGDQLPLKLVDNALCAITVTGIDPDNPTGYTLLVQLENRSTDKNYMFVFENFAVNGLSWGTMSVATLEPGESKDKELCWRGTQYDGIVTEFTDIEMHIRVYDSSDYNAEPAAEKAVHIYPLGKEKAVKNERQPKPGDKKLIDNETFSFVVTGFELKTHWGYSGYTMKAHEINKSDMTLNFYVKDAKVNGIDLDPRLGGNTLQRTRRAWTISSGNPLIFWRTASLSSRRSR